MAKTWLVARHHFWQEASKRSFLILLFMLPGFLALTVGFGYLASSLEDDSTSLGYVDRSGLLVQSLPPPEDHDVQLIPFADRPSAQAALETEQIDAFYVLGPDYRATRKAELVYSEMPPYAARCYFEDVVRINLLSGESPAVIERLLEGPKVTVRAAESNRVFGADGPGFGPFMPIAAAVILAFLALTTSGYMAEVLVKEKESRTMEIIVTSISPGWLMLGKILGALGIALLQLIVWLAFLIGAVWLGRNVLDIGWLQEIRPAWRDVSAVVVVAVPSYLFVAAFMTMVGATLSNSEEAQQVGPFTFLVLILPVYLILPIAANPNGPLALGFSFFPATSFVTIALRSIFMEVPAWQIVTATAVALVGALGTVWLAGRAVRLGMLRYGQRLALRELFTAERSPEVPAPVVRA